MASRVAADALDDIDIAELLDVIEHLVGLLRVGTLDEEVLERDAAMRARKVLARYRGRAD